MSDEQIKISRRSFLIGSFSGLISSAFAAGRGNARPGQNISQSETRGNTIYRTLGRTGIRVPIISMGEGLGLNPAITKAAFEKGIIYFDTAAEYQFGRNEQIVGQLVSRLGIRDKVILATKIFSYRQRGGEDPESLKEKAVSLIDRSLRRMKIDYLDIVYVHSINSVGQMNQPGLFEAMQNLVSLGKAKAIGLATHTGMAAILNEAARKGTWDIVLTSLNFTMADDSELLDAIDSAAESGIGIVAMKTQAGGTNWPNPDSRRKYSGSVINSAALKWVLNNKNVHTAIPGMDNYDHLNANWQIASNLEYTDDEKRLLSDNDIKLSLGFCRQCSQCLASCPNDTDIPTLMRTHMYAAQYGNHYLARKTYRELPDSKNLTACSSCSVCVAECARQSVNIAANIASLKFIYS